MSLPSDLSTEHLREPPLAGIPCVHDLDAEALLRLQAEAAAQAGVAVGFSDPLRDGGHGPALQVIPAGQFLIGSSPREFGHQPVEAPSAT